MVKSFTDEITSKHGKPSTNFADDTIKYLQTLPWTGNIRELKNAIERIIILIDKREIERKDIEGLFGQGQEQIGSLINESNSFQDFKERAERAFIVKKLKEFDWNISKTAEVLEIQRSHLYNKMKKYKIERKD